MHIDHRCVRQSRIATQLDWPAVQRKRPLTAVRSRLVVRRGVHLRVRWRVRLEPDGPTDPLSHPTTQLNRPVSDRRCATTDPCLGVSRRGTTAYGGVRR